MARVLLVDDDAEGLDLRRSILEYHGHGVETATNPADARSLFQSFAPDCVIADLHLPDAATGRALLAEFREAAPELRIILLSGLAAGPGELFDVVLTKPIRSEQLIASITPSS